MSNVTCPRCEGSGHEPYADDVEDAEAEACESTPCEVCAGDGAIESDDEEEPVS